MTTSLVLQIDTPVKSEHGAADPSWVFERHGARVLDYQIVGAHRRFKVRVRATEGYSSTPEHAAGQLLDELLGEDHAPLHCFVLPEAPEPAVRWLVGGAREYVAHTSLGTFRVRKPEGARNWRLSLNGVDLEVKLDKSKPDQPSALMAEVERRLRQRPTVADAIEQLLRSLQNRNQSCAERIAQHAHELLKEAEAPQHGDPLNRLSWSREVFDDAGELWAGRWLKAVIDQHGCTEEVVREARDYLSADFVRKASHGSSRSTSATANLAEDCHVKGLRTWIERLDMTLRWIESARVDAMIDAGDAP